MSPINDTRLQMLYLFALLCATAVITALHINAGDECKAKGGKRMKETFEFQYQCYDAKSLKVLQ